MVLAPLEGWDSFYVIIGSSAAALTGLMFVVIALMPTTRVKRDPKALEAYATPTIMHFCAVLLIAALITIPRHTLESLRLCILVSSAAGIVYTILVIRKSVRQQSYTPELEDWIFHAFLPAIAYAALLLAGWFLTVSAQHALVGIAGAALVLLFVGIHNAWDAAIWMTTAGESAEDDEKKIREVMSRWLSATKAGDLQSVLTLMADDVSFLTPGRPPMNKAGFIETFKGFAGKVKFEASQEVREIYVSGDLAYCWSHLSLTMDGKSRAGNILSVFRKTGDGNWVLSRDANFVT